MSRDSSSSQNQKQIRVLVVKEATEYVHESTVTVVETLRELGSNFNWLITVAGSDLSEFNNLELMKNSFDVIVFAQTSGPIFNDLQLDNLLAFTKMQKKGAVGLHAAADTHRNDPRFTNIFGAAFVGHPPLQTGRVTFDLKVASEVGLGDLPESIELYDEFYNFSVNLATNEAAGFKVFAFADEDSYDHTTYEKPEWEGTAMGNPHPLAWFRDINKSRAFFLALGHSVETYKLPAMRHMIVAAVNWAGYRKEFNEKRALERSISVRTDPLTRKFSDFRSELAVVKTEVNHFAIVIQYDALSDISTVSRIVQTRDLNSMHFIIADSVVDSLYGDATQSSLRAAGVLNVTRIVVEHGEENKSLENYIKVVDQVLNGGIDKHSTIITLGGGMINNLGGMVASTVYRGLRLVHISTSVLSQVDAAVGIKQAVNYRTGKNQIGALYAPSLVILDTKMLETLPMREKINGLGEAIKHALAQDTEFLQYLLHHDAKSLEDPSFLHRVVQVSASLKALCLNSTKAEDHAEFIMQYGHAYGHAIEHLSKYELRHGEAIAIGMTLCCDLAILLGHGDPIRLEQLLELHQQVFTRFNLPWQVPPEMTNQDICETLRHDKHYLHSLPAMMTLKDIGQPFSDETGKTGFLIPYDKIDAAITRNRNRTFVLKEEE